MYSYTNEDVKNDERFALLFAYAIMALPVAQKMIVTFFEWL
jgi:hypothetical protein